MTQTTHRDFIEVNRLEAYASPILLGAGISLCSLLLEPVREHFGQPVIMHSGYRCKGLNAAISGSATSQHVQFEAADFHVLNTPLDVIFNWIWKESGLKWGQLILEGGTKTTPPTWIHLSLGMVWHTPSQQVLTWTRDQGYRRLQ